MEDGNIDDVLEAPNEDIDLDKEFEDEAAITDDGDMPENHHKLMAFQIAIRAVFERQIEKLQLEVNESSRIVSLGAKESEEAARELHDEQKGLVLEEDNVRVNTKKLERSQKRRETREKENKSHR